MTTELRSRSQEEDQQEELTAGPPLRTAAQNVIDATERAQAAEQEALHLSRLLALAERVEHLPPALTAPPLVCTAITTPDLRKTKQSDKRKRCCT